MVTLKDIADAVNVDVSVVSRVLNNKDAEYNFTEECKRRIRETARELGYMPNLSAQSVRTGRFGCVALLVSSHKERSYLPNHLLDSIHDALEKRGDHLLLTKLPDTGPTDVASMPKVFRTVMADGLLVNYTHHIVPELISAVENQPLPVVWINIMRERDSVFPDNIDAGRRATQTLINLGHTNIAYVMDVGYDKEPASAHYSISDRCKGYVRAMRDAGLEPRVISGNGMVIPSADQPAYFERILAGPDRPTGLVLYWSSLSVSVLQASRSLGLCVPQDLSLIAFGSQSSRDSGLSVNAMIEPESEMGEQAVAMLLEKMDRRRATLPSRSVAFAMQDVGTCAQKG